MYQAMFELPDIASMPSKTALLMALPGWAANPAPTAAIAAAGPCTKATSPPPCRSIAPGSVQKLVDVSKICVFCI